MRICSVNHMRAPDWAGSYEMQRTERELTDIEMIDAFDAIIHLIIRTYEDPIRPEFIKQSRAAQAGYDIIEYLVHEDILRTGKPNQQERLDL